MAFRLVERRWQPHQISVFVRSEAELDRDISAVEQTGLMCKILDKQVETTFGHTSVGTMHLAKRLEFRAVVVTAYDDEIIPSQARIETVVDEADLEEVYNMVRHLLYVACTRSPDNLLVTAAKNSSEFLDCSHLIRVVKNGRVLLEVKYLRSIIPP